MDKRLESDIGEEESSSMLSVKEVRAYLDKQRHLLAYLAAYRTNCSDIYYHGIVNFNI